MKAIILAAGYATRLYPLTLNTPKPLLPVGKKLMIEHILAKINELPEVDEVFVVTNEKFYEKFKQWASQCNNRKITVLNDGTISNEDRLGAVGDIAFAIKTANINEELLVIAGDNLFDFSLTTMYSFYSQKGNSVIALFNIKEKLVAAKKFGIVELDSHQRIIGFEEKPEMPKTSLVSTACYIFTTEDVQLLLQCMQELKPDNLGDFIKWLSAKKHVYGWTFSEAWFDIGSHEQYEEVCRRYQ